MFGPAKSSGNCGFGPQIGKSAERVGGKAAPKVGKQQSPAEDWESGSSSSTDEQLAISQVKISRSSEAPTARTTSTNFGLGGRRFATRAPLKPCVSKGGRTGSGS